MKEISIKNQTLISTLGVTIQFFMQWLISILLVRMDGYEAAGVFALAMSISNVFAYFANYGLRNFQITDVDRVYSDEQYILTRIVLLLISQVACIAYLMISKGYTSPERVAILLYFLYNVSNTMGDTLLGAAQIRNHLETNGISSALKGIGAFTFFIIAFYFTKNINVALGFMALAVFLVLCLYDFPVCYRIIGKLDFVFNTDLAVVPALLRDCFGLMVAQLIPILTTAVPRRILQQLSGNEILGYFSSYFTPTVLVVTVASAVTMAVLTKIGQFHSVGERKKVWDYHLAGYLVAGCCIVLGCIVVFLVGKPLLSFMFGPGILTYFPVMYIAGIVSVLNSLIAYQSGIMIAIRKIKENILCYCVALLIALLASKPLVSHFGIYGAAYIYLFAYLIQNAMHSVIITHYAFREGRVTK